MALSSKEINLLGDVIDKTWGRSSTASSGSPMWTINCRMVGHDRLLVQYVIVVNMGHPSEMHTRSAALEEEGMTAVQRYIDGTKKAFKEAAGRALKIKLLESKPSVEMISMSAHNPRRTAYFRIDALASYE